LGGRGPFPDRSFLSSNQEHKIMALRGRSQFPLEKCFFVTTTVVNHVHVFANEDYCWILIRNIQHYQQQYKFSVLGYVVMPSHFHWIVEVEPACGTISDIMRDIKKFCAWEVFEAVKRDQRNDLIKIFTGAARGYRKQSLKFWTDRFDDEVIRNEAMLRTKLEYIHNNPVKAGLVSSVGDYRFSSARNYILGDHSVVEVKTDWF
jgi:putative transposase